MKQVRCVSPHGGCRNGMRHDGSPVQHVFDQDKQEWALPDIPPDRLRLPPNDGGYVADARIPGGLAAVGQVYDVADDFHADGFHWEDLTPQPEPDPEPEGD